MIRYQDSESNLTTNANGTISISFKAEKKNVNDPGYAAEVHPKSRKLANSCITEALIRSCADAYQLYCRSVNREVIAYVNVKSFLFVFSLDNLWTVILFLAQFKPVWKENVYCSLRISNII